jgi:hypothetical protein
MDAVRTPLSQAPALALGNKLWRKEILKAGTIHYKGGKFDATPEYLDSVLAAYRDGAIASVPFTFVDDTGAHVEAPERRKGNIVGLERTPNGLDAILALDDDADELVRKDRKFGVSVLIKHDRTTGGGKHYPAVLAHVAGTYDPVINNLGDWEEIAASNDAVDVLDLLALTASSEQKEQKPMADADTLTPEELAQLRSLLAKADAAAPGDDTPEPEKPAAETAEVEKDDDEDAELAAMVAGLDDAEPELLAASNDTSPAVLALTQRLEAAEQARKDDALQLAQLRDERDESHYLAERENLARTFGIHPSVTDLIKPLLKGGGSKLALANGAEIVPADLIRKFVHELATRPRLDLSQTKGHALDLDNDEADAKNRDALAAEIAASLR